VHGRAEGSNLLALATPALVEDTGGGSKKGGGTFHAGPKAVSVATISPQRERNCDESRQTRQPNLERMTVLEEHSGVTSSRKTHKNAGYTCSVLLSLSLRLSHICYYLPKHTTAVDIQPQRHPDTCRSVMGLRHCWVKTKHERLVQIYSKKKAPTTGKTGRTRSTGSVDGHTG